MAGAVWWLAQQESEDVALADNVPEEKILETLMHHCRDFEQRVLRGEAKLGEKKVDIIPPDPIGELGSGYEKIAAGNVEHVHAGGVALTVGKS